MNDLALAEVAGVILLINEMDINPRLQDPSVATHVALGMMGPGAGCR